MIGYLKRLRSLDLSMNFELNDGHLQYLSGLQRLESLDVSMTRVTTEGAEALREKIPSLVIVKVQTER